MLGAWELEVDGIWCSDAEVVNLVAMMEPILDSVDLASQQLVIEQGFLQGSVVLAY